MLLNQHFLLGKPAKDIKLAHKLSDLSSNYKADLKLIRSEKGQILFCFGVENLCIFEDNLLAEIKRYCKDQSLKLKTRKLKKTTLCLITLE